MTQVKDIVRRKSIGSSDIPVVMGLSAYKSAIRLYEEKRGEVEPDPQSERMEWGLRLEGAIIQKWSDVLGEKYERNSEPKYSNRYAWQSATADALSPSIADPQIIVEAKNIDARYAADWDPDQDSGEDGIPEMYWAQCHWLMSVYQAKHCDICPLIGGNSFRIYRLHYSLGIEAVLLEHGEEFWRRVMSGNPPPLDYGSKATREYLKRQFRKETEPLRAADPKEAAMLDDYSALRYLIRTVTKQKDEIEDKLIERIAWSEGLKWQHGKMTYKRTRDRTETNWQGLALSQLEGYTQEEKRVFIDQYKETKWGYRRIYFKDDRDQEGEEADGIATAVRIPY